MTDTVTLTFRADNRNVALARTVAAAMSARADLPLDQAGEGGLITCLAFPDDARRPAQFLQRGERCLVARPVAGDLGLPVVAIVLRHPRPARAVMPMPETAMHE